MTNSNDHVDVSEWLNKDRNVAQNGQTTVSVDSPESTAPAAPARTGRSNLRLAKFGGLMLVSIYFPILYLLTGLNSIRDWFVFLVLVALTGGILCLQPFRPAFERSIRYFTALMITALSAAVVLIIYKVFL